jgi:hypothetical protein
VLPKVDGGHTRWLFLIPFTVAVLLLERRQLQIAFDAFYWLFALSLLPGMLLWSWIVAGFPIELQLTMPPSDIVQRGPTEYLELPGAVFLLANGIALPHGGALFRLCAIYDEPGTVGTIAALCLAARGFRLRSIADAIAFTAGLMSFSVAFAVLTSLGLFLTAVAQNRPWLLVAVLGSIATGAVPLSGIKFEATQPSRVTIVSPSATSSGQPVTRQRFEPHPQWGLRNAPGVDSREQPRMRKLIDDYLGAPPATLLFGIASDASTIHGWGSSVWSRILTDFGAVGFAWLFALFADPLWRRWREGRLEAPILIFCALFLMSFYQRPIIWLPAQLLLYLTGLYLPMKPAKP